jgi:hypothetical protein
MLQLGVFGGKYMDCRREFPASWFVRAKLSPARRDARVLLHWAYDSRTI